jgi:3-hydroxyacyl-CoA dehydrogenase
MCFNKTINNISVLGAGGKMGGGILTLLVMEMGKNKLKNPKASYTINAIDVSQEALENILVYVEGQLRKFAEKKINLVKTFCSQECESTSDADIVEKYVSELMNMIVISTNLEVAYYLVIRLFLHVRSIAYNFRCNNKR